jgi:hypothetical protein
LKAHPGWVQVPGALIRPDCVHEVPMGAKVGATGDITLAGSVVAHYDACPEQAIITRPQGGVTPKFVDTPGTGNGWVEAVQWEVPLKSGDNIDEITGKWIVPANPSANGGLIYLFNGIEPTTENLILQPVLQWGANGYFGGNYWVIASWLVGSNAYYSPDEKVSAGDTILGTTYITSVIGRHVELGILGPGHHQRRLLLARRLVLGVSVELGFFRCTRGVLHNLVLRVPRQRLYLL